MSLWYVFILALITAICTGLGALPFLFVKNIGDRFVAIGNSVAAGLMLGASIGLVGEAWPLGVGKTIFGLVLGLLLVVAAGLMLPHSDVTDKTGEIESGDFRKILLVMAIMTAHSFAEGIGVGVSFGGREGLGELISAAIAVHNIPEGIAISLVMIPRGASILKASLWSIFSSLPQPLMAVPAFLFVNWFAPGLPVGLGLAAGAMFYMVFSELLPESFERIGKARSFGICCAATVAMLLFQSLL
jgi:zinc transporter ZupT